MRSGPERVQSRLQSLFPVPIPSARSGVAYALVVTALVAEKSRCEQPAAQQHRQKHASRRRDQHVRCKLASESKIRPGASDHEGANKDDPLQDALELGSGFGSISCHLMPTAREDGRSAPPMAVMGRSRTFDLSAGCGAWERVAGSVALAVLQHSANGLVKGLIKLGENGGRGKD
jgi:hypothetical protein